MRHATFVLLFCVPMAAAGLPAQSNQTESRPETSERVTSYDIEARLNPLEKRLEGREVITWRNTSSVPARELQFHLYWNAWKNNRSTWMREDALRRDSPRKIREEDWSYCQIQSVSLLGQDGSDAHDLTSRKRYIAPDDHNPDDQTVLSVPLPRPALPGETIALEIRWVSKIPRTFARTGFRGNYYFVVHWFPKLGVYQADGTWNCHQFHAATEFFSDFGTYDVRLTVPSGWLLGATGKNLATVENDDGTTTHRYAQGGVHDFAWTTSPDYREARRVFRGDGLRPVEMRLLYQPEHHGQVDRHFGATEAALKHYGTWYGEYPYDHVTVVDPAYGSGAGGMEYPTLFTCGTRFLNPFGGGSPESVTVHEAGHQFWYGAVANNEFEHAWLDEGLNTFSADRVMETVYGPNTYVQRFFRGLIPVMAPGIVTVRMAGGLRLDGYRLAVRSDVQATPTFRYHPAMASYITYHKTALWLATLEKTLGWDVLQKILSEFFRRWRFRHPAPDDFFSVASEVSGRDLTGFFNEVHRKAAVFDYSVESISSEALAPEGWVDREGTPRYTKGIEAGMYETQVMVRRLGDGIWPVEILVRFEAGEEIRESWDGRDLWKLYSYVKGSKAEYAAVDPDRKLQLDIDYTNNSRARVSKADFAAAKWASKWMVWLQDYMLALSSLQ